MRHDSPPDLLVLHAVRILGFGDTSALARRFGLDPAATQERVLDAEACGWVTQHRFAGTAGWSLTERGRAENERQLAAELARTRGAEEVRGVHEEFLPLNARLLRACTDWQLRAGSGGRLVPNDHTDTAWDAGVLHALADLGREVAPLVGRLAGVLARFGGYDARFHEALERAWVGDHAWVDRTDRDSCHRVWFELHEDLVATLGLTR